MSWEWVALNEKGEGEEASLSSSKQLMLSTNTLEQTLIFLKDMVIEHVLMILVSLDKNRNPHYF